MSLVYNTHSYFWRHEEQLKSLTRYLLRFQQSESFGVWCAGCAQGEEAYSLAFLFDSLRLKARIMASDIFEDALKIAREGLYPSSKMEKLPAGFRAHCTGSGGFLQVPPRIKEQVTFIRDDLKQSRMEGKFSIVVCRNVLIYFQPEEQAQALTQLCSVLEPGGLLVLGYSESSLLRLEGLERLDDHGIFEKRSQQVKIRQSSPTDTVGAEANNLANALASYARGSLEEAGQLLDASLEQNPNSTISRFFRAMLDIESGRFQTARKNLHWILESEDADDPQTTHYLTQHGLAPDRFQLTVRRVLERLEGARR